LWAGKPWNAVFRICAGRSLDRGRRPRKSAGDALLPIFNKISGMRENPDLTPIARFCFKLLPKTVKTAVTISLPGRSPVRL
jgi:hypothetical protein